MSLNRKKPKADLRKQYRIFFEFGIIVVLTLLIIAMKINFRHTTKELHFTREQEVVKMKKVVRTQQISQPPPPPQPTVPVEVPNKKVLTKPDEIEINFSTDFDISQKLTLPKPPEKMGQGSEKEKKEKIFFAAQRMPVLQNQKEFYSGVKYPAECENAGVEGTVYVSFVVTGSGEVINAEVTKGIGHGCDLYALNYVVKNAKFAPGLQRGEPVPIKYSLAITFNLK